jgi:hypothetical protein
MERLRILVFIFAVALVACPRSIVASHGEIRHPVHLPRQKAEEFFNRACRRSTQGDFVGVVEFSLGSKSAIRRTGRIVIRRTDGEKTTTVTFENGGCTIFGDTDPTLENFGMDGNFSMDREFFQGLVFSPRDLSFLFPIDGDHSYAGPRRVSGRPAQQFLFPVKIRTDGVEISAVRMAIDEKFFAVLDIEFLGDGMRPVRKITTCAFKDFGGTWFPSVVEFTDFARRHRAKLEIFGVKFDRITTAAF